MKLNNLKLVLTAVAVGVPVVWAALVLSEDRPSSKDTTGPSVLEATRREEDRSSDPLARPRTRRSRSPVSFAAASEPEEPEEPAHGSFEEEVAAELQAGHDQELRFVQVFQSQSVDHSWAKERESALTEYIDRDLSELEGFSHSEVECRSSKCLATVTWEDYGSATATVGKAADLTKGECATSVFMPPPDDTSGSYTHKIRLGDCVSFEGI